MPTKSLFLTKRRAYTYRRFKKQVYLLLDPKNRGTVWDRVINSVNVSLILLNLLTVCLETVAALYQSYKIIFDGFERFFIYFFSAKFLLRFWYVTCKRKYRHPIWRRLRYVLSRNALIDLLTILPFYLTAWSVLDLRSVRLLRMTRLALFFKLRRFLNASKVIRRVFTPKKEELLVSLMLTLVFIVLASCTMYFAEHDAQPDKFPSIPETMWRSVAALTTVGYGEVYPVTGLGKTLTAFIAVLGAGMFALPAGILASGFSAEFNSEK